MRNFTELIAALRGAGDERWETMSLLGRWIAVVDDDAAVCNSMRFLLETYHFEVSTYLDGTDFFEENPEVACLIVDYQMPELNGLEFVAELRARGSRVPAIIITATDDPSVERRATELGIRWVLQKPLSNLVLLRAIHDELR